MLKVAFIRTYVNHQRKVFGKTSQIVAFETLIFKKDFCVCFGNLGKAKKGNLENIYKIWQRFLIAAQKLHLKIQQLRDKFLASSPKHIILISNT